MEKIVIYTGVTYNNELKEMTIYVSRETSNIN